MLSPLAAKPSSRARICFFLESHWPPYDYARLYYITKTLQIPETSIYKPSLRWGVYLKTASYLTSLVRFCLRYIAGFLTTELYIVFLFLQSSLGLRPSRSLFKKIYGLTIYGITYGDLALNDYLRNRSNHGILKVDYCLLKACLSYTLRLYTVLSGASAFKQVTVSTKIYHSLAERQYVNDIIRRVFVRLSWCEEVCFPLSKGKLSTVHLTTEFGIRYHELIVPVYSLSEAQVSDICDSYYERATLVSSTSSPIYNLPENDLSFELTDIPADMSEIKASPIVNVLFLNQVADEQFIYGDGSMLDLHTFHTDVVDLCHDLSIPLVLKPHPMSFSALNARKQKIETTYLTNFYSQLGIPQYIVNELLEDQYHFIELGPNLYSMGAKLHYIHIVRMLAGRIFFTTHHGNIYLEALSMDIPCLINKYSRFRLHSPPFSFSCIDEIKALLTKIKMTALLDNPISCSSLLSKSEISLIRQLIACSGHAAKISLLSAHRKLTDAYNHNDGSRKSNFAEFSNVFNDFSSLISSKSIDEFRTSYPELFLLIQNAYLG